MTLLSQFFHLSWCYCARVFPVAVQSFEYLLRQQQQQHRGFEKASRRAPRPLPTPTVNMWRIMIPHGYTQRRSSGNGRNHTTGTTNNSRRKHRHHNHNHHHHHRCTHGHTHGHAHRQASEDVHQHHHHNGSSFRTTSGHSKCQACQAPIGTVTVNGQRVRVGFCQRHNCTKIEASGTLCTAQNNGRTPYCDHRR